MSTMDRSPSHSWWWDSHRSPKKPTKWLQSSIEDLDAIVKRMLDLIEEDADSFAKRAEMYYKKRPELVNMVEQFYRAYRSMAEKYDNLRGEIKQNVPRALQIRYGLLVAGQHRSLSMLAASDLHRTVSTASSTSAGDQADMFSPDCGASSSFSSTASDSEVDDPPPPEAPEVSSSLQEENDFLRSRVDALEREASSLRDQIDRLKAMRRPEEDIVIIRSPSHQEDVQINQPEATPLERVFRTPSHQEHDIDEPEAASPLGREIRSPSHQEDLQIDEPDASPLEREFRLPSHQEYDIDELEAASPLEREIRSPLHQEDQIVEPKASPLEREFRSPSHQEYDGNELEAASPLENEIIRSPSHQEDQINQPEANLPKREFRSPLHQEYDTNELEAASVLEREIIIRPPSHQEDQIDEPKASLPKREIESSSHQEYQLDELNANLLETEIRSSSHQDHCLDNESAADVLEMVASNQAQIVKESPEKEIALALEESAAALLSANFLSADQSNGHNATWVDADFLPVLARFLVMRRGKNDSMIKSMELAASLDTPVHEILEHEEEGDAGDTNGLKTSAGAALRPDAAGLMRRKLSTLEAENQQQKALILEREEEKREAIRQLSYAMDMLKEENTRLERALVLTKMNIDSNNNNNNNNNNHNNNNNNHNNNNNNNNNSRNSKNAKASSSTNVTIVGNHGSMTALASTATTAREMSSWKQILAHALGRESFASVLLDI